MRSRVFRVNFSRGSSVVASRLSCFNESLSVRFSTNTHGSREFSRQQPNAANYNERTTNTEGKDEEIIKGIREKMRYAKQHHVFIDVVELLRDIKTHRLEDKLTSQDIDTAFWGCSMIRDNSKSPIAYWLYDSVTKANNPVPAGVFEKMMIICRNRGDISRARKVCENFKSRDYSMTSTLLSHFMITLAENSQTDEEIALMEKNYKEYLKCNADIGWKSNPNVYGAVALKYCRIGEGDNAVKVLQDLVKYHEPSVELSTKLIEAALVVGDAAVIRVAAGWFLDNFKLPLKDGMLCKILEVASFRGDPILGRIAYKMMMVAGRTPSSSHYFSIVRAYLIDNDYINAIEAMQVMEATQYSQDGDSESPGQSGLCFTTRQYESIKKLLVDTLTVSGDVGDLDQLYFTMVDQVRNENPVPRIALDAIVEAAGRLDITDRAFATFQEYKGLFNVQPDIHSYNSLLATCAYARNINMHTLLSVFQDLDAEADAHGQAVNCRPNSTSFSLLIEAMVDSDDFRVFDAVFAHMTESGVVPSPRAMRRVIVAFMKSGTIEGIEKAEMLKQALIDQQEGRPLPGWFLDRLDNIRNTDTES